MKFQISNFKFQIEVTSAGLTLVEVIIAMGIATVAGVLLLVIIVNSASLFTEQSSKVSTGVSSNDAFTSIRSAILQASLISDQSGPDKLILKVLSLDLSGNIIENTYDDFIFMVDQKNLHFKTVPNLSSFRKNGDRILAGSVENLNFKYFNSASPPVEVSPASARKVRISLNVKASISTAEANLRND